MNSVKLKIIGTQTRLDGDKDSIEIFTQGKYYEKNKSIFLVYDESELSGMEGSTTTLKIDKDQIMMKRFGTNESKLIFEKGVRHKSIYRTMYGDMEMEVMTSRIVLEKNEKGLRKLKLAYRVNICGNTEMKNELSVEVI